MQDLHWLDNIFWHALSGPMARFAVGGDSVRRFAPGFSPIVCFADPGAPDFSAVESLCEPGEQFYTDGWSGPAPAGWNVLVQSTMFKMYWAGGDPPASEGASWIELGPQHVEQAVALAGLTRPGPFGPRTPELGDYLGRLAGGALIAMAGERMQAGSWREISGVCTHPDHQGHGHARVLMLELIRRQRARGQHTCLHVMSGNAAARGLYERMGFKVYRESVVRVIERT